MELAMHCRDSDRWVWVRVLCRSEWTVGVRHSLLPVAFPVGVRQQLFELGDKPREKVAYFGECYSSRCASLDWTEESRHMLFWAGLSRLS